MERKRQYPTPQQKARLTTLLEEDEELRKGKFSNSFTKKTAEAKWNQIAEELNSIPGANKQWLEWRKTWQDMKAKIKRKQVAINRQQNMTGGSPPPSPLSEEAVAIVRTISEPALTGHTGSTESIVSFVDLPNTLPSTSEATLINCEPVFSVLNTSSHEANEEQIDIVNIPPTNKKVKRTAAVKRLEKSIECFTENIGGKK